MRIIGCDYHPGFQQIAFVDTETGDCGERRLQRVPASVSNVVVRLFSRHIASRMAAVSAIVVGALGVALACYSFFIKSEAESLLGDVTALEVGKSTEDDARQFTERHNRVVVSHRCYDNVCSTAFAVQNKWLSALRLEPLAEFSVTVSVKDGRANRISAWLARRRKIFSDFPETAASVDEYLELPREHYGFPTPVGKPYLRVELDSQASALQRQRAFAFSFRCLVKPGLGCDLSWDYLPLAWLDWKAHVRDSGFPMSDFNTAYPNNARCTP